MESLDASVDAPVAFRLPAQRTVYLEVFAQCTSDAAPHASRGEGADGRYNRQYRHYHSSARNRPPPRDRSAFTCFGCGARGHFHGECSYWKTRVCLNWKFLSCIESAACPFAHGEGELRRSSRYHRQLHTPMHGAPVANDEHSVGA